MRFVFLVCVLALGSLACGSSSSEADVRKTDSGLAGSFIGKVDDSDAFAALVVLDTGEALAYVCDSKTIAQWFRGSLTSDVLVATSANRTLRVGFDGKMARGSFTSEDGVKHDFSLKASEQGAGLFQGQSTSGEFTITGGWIILANNEYRGAVTVAGATGSVVTLPTPTPGAGSSATPVATSKTPLPSPILVPNEIDAAKARANEQFKSSFTEAVIQLAEPVLFGTVSAAAAVASPTPAPAIVIQANRVSSVGTSTNLR